MRREDPNFVPPTAAHGRPLTDQQVKPNGGGAATITTLSTQKRSREDEEMEDGRAQKQKKAAEEESDDDEEMEIDDDEDAPAQVEGASGAATTSTSCIILPYLNEHVCDSLADRLDVCALIVPQTAGRPSARLLCTNLPGEVTDSVLSVLFQQFVPYFATSLPKIPH